jgi:hypothetical protein
VVQVGNGVVQEQVTIFEQEAVAEVQRGFVAFNDIVSDASPALETVIDLQGIAFIVIGQAPVIKFPYAAVHAEIHCGSNIVVGKIMVLFAVHVAGARVQGDPLFTDPEAHVIIEQVGIAIVGPVYRAGRSIFNVIMNGIAELRKGGNTVK